MLLSEAARAEPVLRTYPNKSASEGANGLSEVELGFAVAGASRVSSRTQDLDIGTDL